MRLISVAAALVVGSILVSTPRPAASCEDFPCFETPHLGTQVVFSPESSLIVMGSAVPLPSPWFCLVEFRYAVPVVVAGSHPKGHRGNFRGYVIWVASTCPFEPGTRLRMASGAFFCNGQYVQAVAEVSAPAW